MLAWMKSVPQLWNGFRLIIRSAQMLVGGGLYRPLGRLQCIVLSRQLGILRGGARLLGCHLLVLLFELLIFLGYLLVLVLKLPGLFQQVFVLLEDGLLRVNLVMNHCVLT